MDRRHLSIERAAPPGHLAGGRSGLGHRSAGSKTPSPAPVAGKAREHERALETMARRCRPPVLASLFEQARPAQLVHFSLTRRSCVARGRSRMSRPLSRRIFLVLTGGVHPGRGTRNALLSLGERRYLEIIAPDSSQGQIVHFPQILGMTEPRLIAWAVHPPDIAATAKLLRENQIAFKGPDDGSRQRPDGHVLNWKTINLADDRHGLLPFFIEWSADSVHPSKDAPAGSRLEYFEIMSADPDELSLTLKRIGLDLPVQRSDKARLHALISGPKGDLGLST